MGDFHDFGEAKPWHLWALGVLAALAVARAAFRYFYSGDGWISSLVVAALFAAVLAYHLRNRYA